MKYLYENVYPISIHHGNPSYEMYGTLNHIICICVNTLQEHDYDYTLTQDISDFIRNDKEYNIITNISIFVIINELIHLQQSLIEFKYKKNNNDLNKKIFHLFKQISYLICFYNNQLKNYSLIADT